MNPNNNAPKQDENELIRIRRDKLARLQAEGRDPFAITRFDVSHHAADVTGNYDALEGRSVSVAGRMMAKRVMGKASFCQIQDVTGKL
ncbi:MAG: lysine--tRNA ligase, partial [Clostridia bacterium]|nr:lysine--tRNA ligase [Clostridia bacterium]